MANKIRKTPFLVPPPAKSGNGGGSATESPIQQDQEKSAASKDVPDTPVSRTDANALPVNQENTHLVIEKDNVTGGFVYKSIDRKTGDIIKQYPREEVLKAIAIASDAEGLIVDTKA
jgi:flagellar protein FlaG